MHALDTASLQRPGSMFPTCRCKTKHFGVKLYRTIHYLFSVKTTAHSVTKKWWCQNLWSRWPRGLRHVLSSLTRKLGSWAQIPHKAWIFGTCMCLFCVCVFLCLSRGFATNWSLVQGVLPSVKRSWNWKWKARAQGGFKASEKSEGYRSRWPRGLGHGLSSLARMLGSWVRFPLEAWISVWV
jgi:hypothetical protein